mgnify:CR=1 FL=1
MSDTIPKHVTKPMSEWAKEYVNQVLYKEYCDFLKHIGVYELEVVEYLKINYFKCFMDSKEREFYDKAKKVIKALKLARKKDKKKKLIIATGLEDYHCMMSWYRPNNVCDRVGRPKHIKTAIAQCMYEYYWLSENKDISTLKFKVITVEQMSRIKWLKGCSPNCLCSYGVQFFNEAEKRHAQIKKDFEERNKNNE